MTRISLQFHAVREEVLLLLYGWARDLGTNLLVECFWSEYSASAASLSLLQHPGGLPSNASRLCLRLSPVDGSGTSGNDTVDKNPDVWIGTRTPDGVRACMLGASTEDPRTIAAWKTVRGRARTSMKMGAWVVNPLSGEHRESPSHLYTLAAEKLASRGVKLLAGAGGDYYEPFSR